MGLTVSVFIQHGLYMNKDGKFCQSDVLAFGKAFKLSNDIAKHSGRVPLPR